MAMLRPLALKSVGGGCASRLSKAREPCMTVDMLLVCL